VFYAWNHRFKKQGFGAKLYKFPCSIASSIVGQSRTFAQQGETTITLKKFLTMMASVLSMAIRAATLSLAQAPKPMARLFRRSPESSNVTAPSRAALP
jgi:hypothetical protein